MKCPACLERMQRTNAQGIDIHTCIHCEGTWIQRKQLARILRKEGIEQSLAEIEKQSIEARNSKRECTNCENTILKIICIEPTELDHCTSCGGMFFDEGELKKVLPKSHKPEELAAATVGELIFWSIVAIFS